MGFNEMGLRQHRYFRLDEGWGENSESGSWRRFDLGRPDPNNGGIGLATGIFVYNRRAERRALMISELSGGYNVHAVHDASLGWIPDLAHAGLNLLGLVPSGPSLVIRQIWREFFQRCPGERFLQFCHSKGTIYVRRALESLSEEERSNIEVVSIAGATYIPKELCYRVAHYVSERDIVPKLDPRGRKGCTQNTIVLQPHSQAPFFDHTLMSPTYRDAIERHLSAYLSSLESSPSELLTREQR